MPSRNRRVRQGATVLCIVSPNLGILDSWLPVLVKLKTRNPSAQFVALLPTETLVGQLQQGDFVCQLASGIFDTALARLRKGLFLRASTIPSGRVPSETEQPAMGPLDALLPTADAVLFDVTEHRRDIVAELSRHSPSAAWFSLPHGIDPRYCRAVGRREAVRGIGELRVYGAWDREAPYYMRRFALERAHIAVSGIPRHSPDWIAAIAERQSASALRRPYVFLADRPANEAFFPAERKIAALKAVVAQCRELQLGLVVRLHPRRRQQSRAMVDQAIGEAGQDIDCRYSTDHPFVLGRSAHVAITFLSSVAIDMIAVGTPAIEFIDFAGIQPRPPLIADPTGNSTSVYRQHGLVLGANTSYELKKHILHIERDRAAVIEELKKAYSDFYSTVADPIGLISADVERAIGCQPTSEPLAGDCAAVKHGEEEMLAHAVERLFGEGAWTPHFRLGTVLFSRVTSAVEDVAQGGNSVAESALEQVKKLQAERDKLIEQAKEEALRKAEEGVAELNSLGFRYELRERGAKGSRASDASSPKKGKKSRDR